MRRFWAPVTVAMLALLWLPSSWAAGRDVSPFGRVAGVVTDARGTPQMGAAVALIAIDGRTLRQVYTSDKGAFLLERLLPGIYSLRVTLASFLPVMKENILIEPGVNSFLSINLESLFNTMEVLRGRAGHWRATTIGPGCCAALGFTGRYSVSPRRTTPARL